MRSFSELHEIIEKELADLYYPSTPKNLYDPIKYVLNIGGKRIRPILMLLSHQLFSEDIEKSLKAALGIEVFHNFTLLHDDIMDDDDTRRGLNAVHIEYGLPTAINAGDAMLAIACCNRKTRWSPCSATPKTLASNRIFCHIEPKS